MGFGQTEDAISVASTSCSKRKTLSIFGMQMPANYACAIFAAGVVIGQTGENVSLPLVSDHFGAAGSTPYFVVWFSSLLFFVLPLVACFPLWLSGQIGEREFRMLTLRGQFGPLQIGLANALSGIMIVFASPSSRTAEYLQAILGNFLIPMTIIIRAIVMRKLPTKAQLAAAALVLAGLFVSLIPKIAGWGTSGNDSQSGNLWPVWFMLGFVPAAAMNVLEERVLKEDHKKVNMCWFVVWMNWWQLFFVSALFWTDIVPQYGMSPNIGSWKDAIKNGFDCYFFGGGCGHKGFVWESCFVGGYMLVYLSGGQLLRYSEGSVWQAIVLALVGPLGAFWWTLFQEKNSAGEPDFHWGPEWARTSTFSVLGLLLMVPGIVVYKLFSSEEDGDVADKHDDHDPLLQRDEEQ
eukprot:TRINITY_DN5564_c0_g1_i1.p1 TRINITY_DN5564_c0_g1~~TRINITY_DN5564_c0_g1_i1.p1  ORF type:complete len:427 (+),score=179.42 TRINITY_DN5564_c0_g1_i1:64-1281(+)